MSCRIRPTRIGHPLIINDRGISICSTLRRSFAGSSGRRETRRRPPSSGYSPTFAFALFLMSSHHYMSDSFPSSNGAPYSEGWFFSCSVAFQSDDEMGNQGSLPYPPSSLAFRWSLTQTLSAIPRDSGFCKQTLGVFSPPDQHLRRQLRLR